MVVNDGSLVAGCVVSCSEEAGTLVEVGSVITVYIAADPSVAIPAAPETPPAGGTDTATPNETPQDPIEYDTD